MKAFKKIIAVLAVTVMALSIVACGSSKGPDITGVYNLYAIEQEGLCIKAEGLLSGSIEIKDGGKAVMKLDEDSTDLEYKVDGEKVTLTADGDSQEVSIKDGILIFDIEGSKAYFATEKADTSSIEAMSFEEAIAAMMSAEE